MGRPLGIAFLAVVAFLIGLAEILRSFVTFTFFILALPFGPHFPSWISFPLYLLLGLTWIFISYSFWRGLAIGWVLGILMAVVVAFLNFPVGTVLGLFVFIYLIVPRGVRNWFSRTGWKMA
ncbi:MAG: hypothetical protein ACP5UZ_07100 [Thermoplasmata archaeon]